MVRFKAGERFGSWTNIQKIRKEDSKGKKQTKWVCRCDCGTISLVRGYDLSRGKSTKCKKCYGTEFQDLTGKNFNDWKVIKYDGKLSERSMWLCECKCGNKVRVCGATLKDGRSKRCLSCSGNVRSIHGFTSNKNRHPLYNIWRSMIARCENVNHVSFEGYGGRGISVCERWKDLRNFCDDMGSRPHGYTIERIDNEGNYEPSNCKWASHKQQNRNRRSNRCLIFGEKMQTLGEWAIQWKIKPSTLWRYLTRHSIDEAYQHYVGKYNQN